MSSSSSTNTAAAEELVGLRFNPTDQELLGHYLMEKMQGKDSHFPEINCCNHEPLDLLALLVPNPDMEGFFFSPRDYKYAKSKRSNRATVQGFWKITGKRRVIKDRHSQDVIGYKRTLTFYKGRVSNSHKTNYVMHEYEHKQNGDCVLCRLKIKSDPSAKKKDSSISDEADPDMIAGQVKEVEEDPLLPKGNVGECKAWDESFSSDLDIYIKQQFPQQGENQESLIHPTQPHQQQDYCSSTLHLPKEAKGGNVPHDDVNNGECSWGQSPLGDHDSCLTNKNNISTNDNHEPVSNTASNFGSATDDSTREVFTQPGQDLGPLGCPLLQDYPLLSPIHTEPRDVQPGNNYIAGNELQSQFEDYDFSLIDYYPDLQTTPSPSIGSNQPKSLGTQPPNSSFQGYSALATGETLQCS